MYMKFINPWIENHYIEYAFMVFWRIFILFFDFSVFVSLSHPMISNWRWIFGFLDNEQKISLHRKFEMIIYWFSLFSLRGVKICGRQGWQTNLNGTKRVEHFSIDKKVKFHFLLDFLANCLKDQICIQCQPWLNKIYRLIPSGRKK